MNTIKKNKFGSLYLILTILPLQLFLVSYAQSNENDIVQKNVDKLLRDRQCSGCNLKGAILDRTDLQYVNVTGADLSNARFYLANLQGANLQYTSLRNAHFGGADISEANFEGADITGASFTGTYRAGTLFLENLLRVESGGDAIRVIQRRGSKQRKVVDFDPPQASKMKSEKKTRSAIENLIDTPKPKKIRFFDPVKINE